MMNITAVHLTPCRPPPTSLPLPASAAALAQPHCQTVTDKLREVVRKQQTQQFGDTQNVEGGMVELEGCKNWGQLFFF